MTSRRTISATYRGTLSPSFSARSRRFVAIVGNLKLNVRHPAPNIATVAEVGSSSEDLAISPDDAWLYVAGGFDPHVTVIRTQTNTVTDHLARDVGFKPGDLTADGGGYLPGDTVTLTATLRNLGDLPVENVEVAFCDGDPVGGGTEILPRQTVTGILDGGATATVTTTWVIPEPARTHAVYVVADPDGLLGEADRSNNQLSLSVGGSDLEVSLASKNVASDGSARVIVQVANRGAPAAPASITAIRYAGTPESAPLGTVATPWLDPGTLAQIALDLPAGSVTAERLFTVTADDGSAVRDIDRENNTVTFAMSEPAPPCLGDCDGSDNVGVNELIRGVNISLGKEPIGSCPEFDGNHHGGKVTIDELVGAVNRALNGCP